MPIGLFAVMGPSRKEKRGPPRFWATRRENTRSRSQKSRTVGATATKSSGPGVVNMLASPCLVLTDPGSGDAVRDGLTRAAKAKRPPGTLTAVGYVRVVDRPSAQTVLRA